MMMTHPPIPELIGGSAALVELKRQIDVAAKTTAKVLILGETGSGKEVVARMLHRRGSRSARPFVVVNCSGIPETLLESELFGHRKGSFTGAYRDKTGLVRQADGGTLFLDELGEMSLRMQAALLRFTETGEIQQVGADGPIGCADVRLITATNRDLRAQVTAGAFREDLYYRLNVVQIRVPPLRERRDDVLALTHYFLRRSAMQNEVRMPELGSEAAALLRAYDWPGNVRELRNIAERLVLQDRRRPLRAEDLPAEIRSFNPEARLDDRSSSSASRSAGTAAAPGRATLPQLSPVASALWDRMAAGEDFWSVVHQAFKARQLTRVDLAAVIDRGLIETCGSYRAMLRVFHLPSSDYKRFHAFLYQQHCNLPVAPYRRSAHERAAVPASGYRAAS